MVSRRSIHNIIGIIGNVISFGLFLSPVPTFYKIWKKKDAEEFQPYPYIATVLNCLFWIFYGMPFVTPDSMLVITINAIGLVIELIYLAIFCIYAKQKTNTKHTILGFEIHLTGRMKVGYGLAVEVAFFAAMVIATMLGFHTHHKRNIFVGVLCDIFNILMYSSPLMVVGKVIKTKSVKYMPFYLSLANFANGCIWSAYALIRFDAFMIISNGVGAIAGFLQLVIYACYYWSTPKDDGALPTKSTELASSV